MALTALKVSKQLPPGKYGDGNGLWLQVSTWGTKSWLYRYQLGGKARSMGLGSADVVSLVEARDLAHEARIQVRAGRDPIEARKAAKAQRSLDIAKAMTFKDGALLAIAAREAGWSNEAHRREWKRSLEAYAFPTIGDLAIGAVDTGLVLKCLEPIWATKRTTAERTRGRIEAVLDWAAARGYRTGDNPARWRGHLEHLLNNQSEAQKHLAALPYDQMAEFMAKVRARSGMAARALEFCILTATRTGEAINARWSEIGDATWTVPPERMKGTKDKRKEHRVPLSRAALALLNGLPRINEFVFPGRGDGPLHPKAMNELLCAMGVAATVHGFRSSFRDWAAECTAYPREVCEAALAHAIASKVEAAYRRGDLFAKRARLMEDWAKYCAKPAARQVQVVPIKAHRP